MNKLDKIGMSASILCAIHCSLMPFLLLIIPIFSLSLFVTEIFEWVFLILSFLLGISSLCFGYKKHKSYKVFPILCTGFCFLVIGRIMHNHYVHEHEFHFDIYNVVLIMGGLLVAASHYLNSKLCKSCDKCKHK